MRTNFKHRFALQGSVVPLLFLVLLIVTGEKLWERFLPKYLEEIGASVLIIGSSGFLQNLLGAGWALQGGYLSDRLGDRRAFRFFSLLAVAALIYLPVARFSDRMERKPFVVATFVFFTLFPALLFFSKSWWMLVLAFVVRGLKEFGEPTRKAMILDLSVEGAEARTVGVYYFVRDFVVAFAAFVGGWLWMIDPAANLWTAAGFGLVGTVAFAVFGKGTEPNHTEICGSEA